jgi:hypothetical protein
MSRVGHNLLEVFLLFFSLRGSAEAEPVNATGALAALRGVAPTCRASVGGRPLSRLACPRHASARRRGLHHPGAASLPMPGGRPAAWRVLSHSVRSTSATAGSGVAMAHRQPARARAMATVTRGAWVPRATRGRYRVQSLPGAFPRRSWMTWGGFARRSGQWRLTLAGER